MSVTQPREVWNVPGPDCFFDPTSFSFDFAGFFTDMDAGNVILPTRLRKFFEKLERKFAGIYVVGQQSDTGELLQQLLSAISAELKKTASSFVEKFLTVEREQQGECDVLEACPAWQIKRQPDLMLEPSPVDHKDHVGCNSQTVTKIMDLPPVLTIRINRSTWQPDSNTSVKITHIPSAFQSGISINFIRV